MENQCTSRESARSLDLAIQRPKVTPLSIRGEHGQAVCTCASSVDCRYVSAYTGTLRPHTLVA